MITKNPAEFDKKKKVLDLALDRSLSEHIMKVGSKYQNVTSQHYRTNFKLNLTCILLALRDRFL